MAVILCLAIYIYVSKFKGTVIEIKKQKGKKAGFIIYEYGLGILRNIKIFNSFEMERKFKDLEEEDKSIRNNELVDIESNKRIRTNKRK